MVKYLKQFNVFVEVNGYNSNKRDDLFILQHAFNSNSSIISNDQYRNKLEEDIKTETPQLKTPLKYIEQPTGVIEPEPVITYPDRPQVSTKFWETLFEGVDDKKKKLKKIRQNIKKQNKKEIMRFLSMVNLDKYTDNFLDNEFYTVQEILDYPLIEEELDELGMINEKEQQIYKYYIDEVNKLQN